MLYLEKEINFEHYTKTGVISEHYPLHRTTASDMVRKSVNKYYPKLVSQLRTQNDNWSKYLEPVHMLKKYYGERFGFYYLYLINYQAMLLYPALVGVLLFAQQILSYIKSGNMNEAIDSPWNGLYGLFLCIWASVFVELWKEKEDKLIFEWDLKMLETDL